MPEESPTYDSFGDEIDHYMEIESEITEHARSLAENRDLGPAAHGDMTHSLWQETSAHASQVADGIPHGDSSFRLQAPTYLRPPRDTGRSPHHSRHMATTATYIRLT